MFIHPSVLGHLDGCHVLAIVNNVATDTGAQISTQVLVLDSFGYIPSSGTAGSHGSSVFNLEELPNCFP